MATLTYAAFIAKYETYFADNTTQAITEAIMREFKDDIGDSFTLSGGLNWITVQIGDWDMDATSNVAVTHGIADFKKIRSFSGIIRNDADTVYYVIDGNPDLIVGSAGITSTTITVGRVAASIFDDPAFNATSYNRGWITIGYVS